MKTLRLVTLVALLGMFGLGNAIAQKGSGQKGQKQGKSMHGQLFNDLSDTQKEQMKAFHVEFIKEATPMKNELAVLEAKMQQASTGDNINTKEVNSLIDEITELKGEMAKKNFANKQKIRNILTDDQKVMFDARADKMHKQRKQGMKGRNGKQGRGAGAPDCPRASVENEAMPELLQ